MKRLIPVFLAFVMIAAFALADQPLYDDIETYSVLPPNAMFVRTGTDDGLTVNHYRTSDGTRYEVKTSPESSSVVMVDIEAADSRGSATVTLTEEQAENALLALFPDASVHLVYLDRDDGRSEYDVYFTTPHFSGHAELHPESGALLEAELNYAAETLLPATGALTAEQAKALALSLVQDGRITEFEIDRESGRTVYEGEVRTGSTVYEFVIDAESGRVTEWERDD